MIYSQGISNVIPNATNLDEAEAVYFEFYTKGQEKEFGVIALELQLI